MPFLCEASFGDNFFDKVRCIHFSSYTWCFTLFYPHHYRVSVQCCTMCLSMVLPLLMVQNHLCRPLFSLTFSHTSGSTTFVRFVTVWFSEAHIPHWDSVASFACVCLSSRIWASCLYLALLFQGFQCFLGPKYFLKVLPNHFVMDSLFSSRIHLFWCSKRLDASHISVVLFFTQQLSLFQVV